MPTVRGDLPHAVASLEQAVAFQPTDARLLYELDLLCEAAGIEPATRLARLEQRVEIVRTRDDALTRMIVLLIAARRAGPGPGLAARPTIP